MRKSLLSVAVAAACLIWAAPTGAAATSVTTSRIFQLDVVVFVPCANGGAGEEVALSGPIHDLFHLTFDGAGGVTLKVLDNRQNVSGTGLTTGTSYRGTGGTQAGDNVKVGETLTNVNTFQVIGQGPGNNFLVHDNFHVTVNADGTVTADHDNFSVDCM